MNIYTKVLIFFALYILRFVNAWGWEASLTTGRDNSFYEFS